MDSREVLEWEPGRCAHCLAPLDPENVSNKHTCFCNAFCQRRAEDLRYVRTAIRDGRIPGNYAAGDNGRTALTLFANKIVFLQLDLAYVRPKLSDATRAEVLADNDGRCTECNERPATEVDHIHGGSEDRENLRGLCRVCHETKPRGPVPADLTREGQGAIDESPEGETLKDAWGEALFSFEAYDPAAPSAPWLALKEEAVQARHTRFGAVTLELLDETPPRAPADRPQWKKEWGTYQRVTKAWAASAIRARDDARGSAVPAGHQSSQG